MGHGVVAPGPGDLPGQRMWQAPSAQRVEEPFGLSQVGSVKPLGKPMIGLGKQLAGGGRFPLLLPQPAQAHGSPQFQGFGVLLACQVQGLLKPVLSPRRVRGLLAQQAFAQEPIDLRPPPADPPLVH